MTARLLTIPARDETPSSGPQLTQEAEYLRHLLETQPSCLLRVSTHGRLLAANEAALALLGAEELAQVVDQYLTGWIDEPHRAEWPPFAERVWDEGPASIEWDITTVAGPTKRILFQVVPLRDHPDQVKSLLLTARDVSGSRRLEATLEDQNAAEHAHVRKVLEQARAELDLLRAERDRAEIALRDHEVQQQRLVADHGAEVARLNQSLAEHSQLITMLTGKTDAGRADQERHSRELDEARAQLASAANETASLKSALEQREAEYQRLDAEYAARLQQATSNGQDRTALLEQYSRELGDVRAQLASALDETANLKSALAQRDDEHRQTAAAHATERAQLDQAVAAERDRAQGFEQQAKLLAAVQMQIQTELEASTAHTAGLKDLLRQHESALADLRRKLVNAAGERQRLDETLKEQDAAAKLAVAEHAAERSKSDQALLESVRQHADAMKLLADQKLELQILLEHVQRLEPLAAAGRLALDVNGELRAVLAQIEQRAVRLIEQSSTSGCDRGEIEQLRRETAGAVSLARQLVLPETKA